MYKGTSLFNFLLKILLNKLIKKIYIGEIKYIGTRKKIF